MDTTWELPFGDETLHVYAHAGVGRPTEIGFAHENSERRFLIRRDVDDAHAWVRFLVETDPPGGYTFQDDDYRDNGWTPDPRAQVITDFVNALTGEELLQIAQTLADQELADAEGFVANRLAAVERKQQDLTEARRRVAAAHLVIDALQQPAPVRQTAVRLAPAFTGEPHELREIAEHLTGNHAPDDTDSGDE